MMNIQKNNIDLARSEEETWLLKTR